MDTDQSEQNYGEQGGESIEMLKTARNKVIQDVGEGDQGGGKRETPQAPTGNPAASKTSLEPLDQTSAPIFGVKSQATSGGKRDEFIEAFIEKLNSVEQAEKIIDQELTRIETLQVSLAKEKNQLASRKNKFSEIKKGLMALNKEIETLLHQS